MNAEFKKGDRVRLVNAGQCWADCDPIPAGQTGTVLDVAVGDALVQFDDATYERHRIKASVVNLVVLE